MKIAVLGAGAIGCLFGGLLAIKGEEVTFIDVFEPQIEAINKNGIRIIRDTGKKSVSAKACFAKETADIFDLILLCTKTVNSRSAMQSVIHLIHPGVTVMSIQNGLDNDILLQEFVEVNQIIIGMTGFPADLKGLGIVESRGSSFTSIIDATGVVSERTKAIADKITKAGLNCVASQDTFCHIWEKASFNAAMNSIAAVTKLTVGQIDQAGGKGLAYDIADEAIRIAQAKGIPADFSNVKSMLDKAFLTHRDHKPSMLQDLLAKRETEVESINGAIVKNAKEMGSYAPLNQTMLYLVRILQNSYNNI